MKKQIITAGMIFIIFMLILLFMLSGCVNNKNAEVLSAYNSYTDVPDISADEINAIKELQKEDKIFKYGVPVSTEAFFDEKNEIKGFAELFCEWLTDLFDIEFKPVNYEFADLFSALETGEIDFAGGLAPTEARREKYYMTDAFIERNLVIYRVEGSPPLSEIQKTRKLEFVFLKGSATTDLARSLLDEDSYEAIYVERNSEARELIETGKADGFIHQNTSDILFNDTNIISEDFVPPAFISVCLTAQNDKFAPIISVVQKTLEHGQLDYIANLYKKSEREYTAYKLFSHLTDEEIKYIKENPVIPVAAEYGNYPVSFYNNHEKQWQGISFDILNQIADLTGISFDIINNKNANEAALLQMLKDRRAVMISGFIRSADEEQYFLWSDKPIMSEKPALISKTEYRHAELNELLNLKIGLVKDSVYADIYGQFFPHLKNTKEYEDKEAIFSALVNGEVDMIFLGESSLLNLSNYKETAGYKINKVFDYPVEYTFGFNKDEKILRSIINKAVNIIDTDEIASQWTRKTYDYRIKIAETKVPWVITVSLLLMCVLALILILVIRKSREDTNKRAKITMNEIQEANERMHLLLDAMPLTCHLWNENLEIFYCNEENVRLFNLKNKQEFLENFFKFAPEYQPDGQNSGEAARMYVKKAFDEGRCVIEFMHQTLDGSLLPTEVTLIRVAYKDGYAVAAYIRDLREQNRILEIEKQVSNAKSNFLANMSHEMRTPLNTVIGLTGLSLENDKMTDETRLNLEKIYNAGTTLLGIVNDVLDISKIEAGKIELTNMEYDVPSLINDTITQNILYINDKPIELKLDIGEDMFARLYGDELRIKQIMNNLLSNAMKYTQKGTVELGIYCVREEDIIWLTIKVSDTGRGIHPEDIEKLFLEYYQADVKANRNIEGTGLGLPITKKLAEMMDGKLTAESEYGKGSIFTAKIAQAFVNDVRIGPQIVENLKNFRYSDEKRNQNMRLKRIKLPYARVLVVDDNTTNLDVAKGLMNPYGMQIDCVTSGQEAVNVILTESFHGKNARYNAVFMDHMMPGMDGMEAVQIIREIGTDYAKNIPIIALTANAVSGNEEKFLSSGFQAFLIKPVDIMRLDAIIRRWVRDKSKDVEIIDDDEETDGEEKTTEIESSADYKIDGLNISKGIENFGGGETYFEILRSYAVNTRPLLEKIDNISEEKLSDYAITVHGIKGSSYGISAESVGILAEKLEKAAKDWDYDFVLKNNAELIAAVKKLLDDIEFMLAEINASKTKQKRFEPDGKLLQKFIAACKNYDINGADEIMSELEKYEYESDGELIKCLKDYLSKGYFEKIIEKFSNL